MSQTVLFDTGPLGLITHPKASSESDLCNQWMREQIQQGVRVLVAGVSDYELRREMILNGTTNGIAKLDARKDCWIRTYHYRGNGSSSRILGAG